METTIADLSPAPMLKGVSFGWALYPVFMNNRVLSECNTISVVLCSQEKNSLGSLCVTHRQTIPSKLFLPKIKKFPYNKPTDPQPNNTAILKGSIGPRKQPSLGTIWLTARPQEFWENSKRQPKYLRSYEKKGIRQKNSWCLK